MKRIYGGIFGAPSAPGTEAYVSNAPNFIRPDATFLASGRAAIEEVIRTLKPRKVWLPNYLCTTMLTPAIKSRSWDTYQVNRFFDIDGSFLKNVENNDAVIFINYFGIRYPEEIGQAANAKGAWVIEDSCMGLFTAPSPISNFVIRSLTKNLGLSDGGILSTQSFVTFPASYPSPPAGWITASKQVREERRLFDLHYSDSKEWLTKSVQAKKMCPKAVYKISPGTKNVFFAQDFNRMMVRQTANYNMLEHHLRRWMVLSFKGDNSTGGCPGHFFPIAYQNRDKLQKALFRDNIFPAIHWKLPWKGDKLTVENKILSSSLLSIPCDWRYNEEDMNHIAERIKFHIKNLN